MDALHLGWFFTKSIKTGWAPAEDAFRARAQAKLSGPMLEMAMSDFERALDGARLARQQDKNEYAVHFFAANMSEEDLKIAGEYYAGPQGQKMLLKPDTMSPEERRAQGQFMLAHPGLIRASQIQLRLTAAGLKDVEIARLTFAKDFQLRLCDALRQDHIQASLCLPANAIH